MKSYLEDALYSIAHFQFIYKTEGIKYFSSPHKVGAIWFALSSISEPIVLIIQKTDQDFSLLSEVLHNVKALIIMGDKSPIFHKIPVIITTDCLPTALKYAKLVAKKGDVVITA